MASTIGSEKEGYINRTGENDIDKARNRVTGRLPTSRPRAEEHHGDKDLDKAGDSVTKPLPTSGSGAEEHHEDDEEDLSKIAENFSKIAKKVSKAIPRRYREPNVPTIYVVPRDLAESAQEWHEPEVVCIGPLFDQKQRRKEPWLKLEKYKWCCLRKLVVNAGCQQQQDDDSWIPDKHEPLLRKCLDTLRDLEPQIRNRYGDIPIGGSNTLAMIMLLDGSFLLHRLLKLARTGGGGDGDDDDWTQVVGRCGIWEIVTRDLILLKNQIPFFVLQRLLEHLRGRANESDDILVEGGLRLLASLRPGPAAGSSSLTIPCRNVHHLLHLLYVSIVGNLSLGRRPRPLRQEQDLDAVWVPCAKELEEAGVSFQAKTRTTFLSVSFYRGVLEIPPLELYDYSKTLFRNLIAFEQTYIHAQGHITAYAVFMDCLIKTPEDMRVLHHSGVLVSHMNGERDLATGFFSSVCAQAYISMEKNYLQGLMEDVVTYQSRTLQQWRAVLKRDYFSNPWVTTSVVAAFLVLAMTVLQTFFTIYGYYKPRASN